MKISNVRSLLIVFDVLLVASIGGVVFHAMKEKDARKPNAIKFRQDVESDLEKVRPAIDSRATDKRDYPNITTVNLTGEKPVEKVVEVVAPTPVAQARPELSTVLRVVAVQRTGINPPSIAYIMPKTQTSPKPDEGLKDVPFYVERQLIEWAHGAVVKRIEATNVTFEYDGKEVTIEVPVRPPEGAAVGGAASPGGARPLGTPPVVTEDPAGWIFWDQAKPGQVAVTETGKVSLQAKGESVLEGVRWSTEILEDGKPALKVDFIPENNVLQKGTVQSGDVLESINGTRVTSKADVVEYVQRNPRLSQYTVVILRKGTKVIRVVNVPRS